MIQNLRDVGETINIIHGKEVMKEAILFRGGSVNDLFGSDELPKVKCILNLRTGRDSVFESIEQIHLPAVNSTGNYFASNGNVKRWIKRVLAAISKHESWPLLVHCSIGRDRTGVIIAAILLTIGIDEEAIVEDYMLTEGVKDCSPIREAISGIGDIHKYLNSQQIVSFMNNNLTKVAT